MSLYLGTYETREKITVWNVQNTTNDPKVRVCQFVDGKSIAPISWYDLWKNAVGDDAPQCSVVGCGNPAQVGGHVSMTAATSTIPNGSNRAFICPLCIRCNNARSAQISIRKGVYLIHLGLFNEDILPNEYALVADYETSQKEGDRRSWDNYYKQETARHIADQKAKADRQRTQFSEDCRKLMRPVEDGTRNLIAYAQSIG